ncbi:hypothetical protein Bbelb_126820 [Branchiostoma belcheri]|nr:hypothetical protein Bbelb_126820 [Branchiostoma belcheri]
MAGNIHDDFHSQLLAGEREEPKWMRKKPQLTVLTDSVAKDESSDGTEVHMCLKVLKLVLSIFVGCALLACLVSTKVTTIIIAQSLAENWNATNATSEDNLNWVGTEIDVKRETAIVALTIIIMMPYLLTFIRCVWRGRWGKNTPWPTREALLFGVLTAVLEVVGLTMFTVVVMALARRSLSIVLMNSIFLIPSMVQIYRHSSAVKGCATTLKEGCKQAGNFMLNTLAMLLAAGSLVAVLAVEIDDVKRHPGAQNEDVMSMPTTYNVNRLRQSRISTTMRENLINQTSQELPPPHTSVFPATPHICFPCHPAHLFSQKFCCSTKFRRRFHTVTTLYKLLNGHCPPHLQTLIPRTRASATESRYPLRNSNHLTVELTKPPEAREHSFTEQRHFGTLSPLTLALPPLLPPLKGSYGTL